MPTPDCETHGVAASGRDIIGARAVGALRKLVDLKDGPRDDSYRLAKDAAWSLARDVLKQATGE